MGVSKSPATDEHCCGRFHFVWTSSFPTVWYRQESGIFVDTNQERGRFRLLHGAEFLQSVKTDTK